ncbi:hypothetical protein P691DRAFT_781095 [Macrolepiota fuliginosa MF-IS2]|uniref:LysM domain-containing protein n=1 Tax=Macrolepiota fuliginosa MF-IS2 TaxID=1400762 RepID=A0A9P5XE10_9AGAR|nr:hypothetical protein P691DRAFT_781095 [Macrolepiota fuliginosa MF-IS2]
MFSWPRFAFGIPLVAVLVTGAAAQAALSKSCIKTGRKWTNSCDDLARMYEVSNFQLRFFNPWLNDQCDNGDSRDILCLVKKGEDCTQISRVGREDRDCTQWVGFLKPTLEMDVFLANNGMKEEDCYRIHRGQIICTDVNAIPYGHSK